MQHAKSMDVKEERPHPDQRYVPSQVPNAVAVSLCCVKEVGLFELQLKSHRETITGGHHRHSPHPKSQSYHRDQSR